MKWVGAEPFVQYVKRQLLTVSRLDKLCPSSKPDKRPPQADTKVIGHARNNM